MQVVVESSAHLLRYRRAVRWTADKIRERREDLGLTQAELAKRLGVSLRTITAWEAGHARPQRPSKLDAVLGAPDQKAKERLAEMTDSELVAQITERIAELSRRLPQVQREDVPAGMVEASYDPTAVEGENLGTRHRA